MRKRRALHKLCTITITFFLICVAFESRGQHVLVNDAKKKQLADLSVQLTDQFTKGHERALALAKIHGWPVFVTTKNGGTVSLQGVNGLGLPIYLSTYDNTIAAATTSTNTVQPGGSLGLNLSGSSAFLANRLAIWDAGAVYKDHQEFAGKTVTIYDNVPVNDHATHVAGTMVAKGINPPVKGMAFGATTLHSYVFDNDVAKMTAAAPGLLLSNHSYGILAGWFYDETQNRWTWYGLPGDTVDYNYGFYGQGTQAYDNIAYNAPYYLIVQAAGNFHGYPGPAVGGDYWGFKSLSDMTLVDKGPRPPNISSNGGYDAISTTGNAKNILTVGAINPLPGGPVNGGSVSAAFFSSWGPTDDGRVKPDIVGDGVNVLSCGSSGPADYISLSGTSMATPNVTGSLYLLQEYYAKKNGKFMRAATLKGLACHTAIDVGNAGPDYIFGWGLLDVKQAAQAITDDGGASLIKEKTLGQGQQQTFTVTASGNAPLIASISWTDPPGTPTSEGIINSRTPKLVNDLDIRISDGTTTFYPWILDPSNPSAVAHRGDNVVDNVEQVFIPGARFDKTYTITVSHKGALQSGSQDYSLIVTGLGGTPYCSSGPLSKSGSRINNVTLANLNNAPPPGCTTYSDFTGLTVQLAQGQTYPLSIAMGTCGANFNKAAKVYIDWNGDGIFEANELVATTNIINATGAYTTSITVPASVIPGNAVLMRVVLTETSDISDIEACAPYGKGETQDYKVLFLPPPAAAVTAENLSGVINTCLGMASASPDIAQFTASGINLSSDINITAPPGFEISLASGSGFCNSLTLPLSGRSLANTTIYVRAAASASLGGISGNVVLTSSGITQQIAVTGQVNSWATINPVANQGPYSSGATTNAINFSGTGHAYSWVNDTPGIGLAASGNGDIPPFTVLNATKSPITATVTVTPIPSPAYAYVPNAGSNVVSVINTSNNSVVTEIPVGMGPETECLSPDGSRVYVANSQSNSVSVIDATNNSVIAIIPTGLSPGGMTTNPDGSKLYVCNQANISVFSTQTYALLTNIKVGEYPAFLAFNRDGGRLYVTNNYLNQLYVINTTANVLITTIKVGQVPYGVITSPDGSKVYVANAYSDNISIINTATNTVVGSIKAGVGAYGLTFSPDGSRLYVTNSGNQASGVLAPGSVAVISTANNSVIKIIPIGVTYPVALQVTPDGSKLYVVNDGGVGNLGSVTVINTVTNSIDTTVKLKINPLAMSNFIVGGEECTGPPVKFIITVNPSPAITAGAVTGTITACSGSASVSPGIQQFTVSGAFLTHDITVTAPPGFEVSVSAGSGYGNSVTLTAIEGTVKNTVIYVRSAALAAPGNVLGNVVVNSDAVSQNVAVMAVVTALADPSISITSSSDIFCAGSAAVFTAAPINGGNTPVYQWLLNGSNAGSNNPVFSSSTLVTGDVISCTITSNAPCATPLTATSNSITVTIDPLEAPSVSITASANNICAGTPVTFTAAPVNSGGTPVYQWLLNGNNTGTNAATFVTSALANADVVSCVMSSNAPCAARASVTSNSLNATVLPVPTVNAGRNKTIKAGGSVVLNATVTGDSSRISWSPSTGLSNANIADPIANPPVTTTYTITVQSADGCPAMDNVTVEVLQTIDIPNTFTPNGDGINDIWNIKNLNQYPDCTVKIYTRWGQNVFSSIGYGIPWNGMFKGTRLSSGAYYYIIDLKTGGKVFSGFVAIIK